MCYVFPILTKMEIFRKILVNTFNVKFR